MKLIVMYDTPTAIHIDTETKQITRIYCLDSETHPQLDADKHNVVLDEGGNEVQDAALRDLASQIVEDCDDWPGWEWA